MSLCACQGFYYPWTLMILPLLPFILFFFFQKTTCDSHQFVLHPIFIMFVPSRSFSEMHARTRPSRHPVLKLLYRRLKDSESFFLSPRNLQDLGIRASQVDITDDGILQFRPCFFRPYPERILQVYPLDTSNLFNDLPVLYYQPDFASMLAEVCLKYPDAEDPLKIARFQYEEHAMLRSPDEWLTHARETESYIRRIHDLSRKGRPELSSLLDLGTLQSSLEPTKHDPPTHEERPGGPSWQMKQLLDNSHENPPLPHAIMATIAHVPANFEPQSLTLHELRAIVNMLIIRTSHRPFRNYSVHPLLLLSYMGQKHGRIIQASFDGEKLILQYSQLWCFEDEATALVELFVRYNISQLVGLERPQLDVPSLRESFTSMDLT
ncbi:unnamed protein product [Penicillium salamii]|uniref:Uncharacterized protein n=1 Tax=Penicillium salamii TaxID=1612424 RepID=A0A9W4J6Z9_9EURO|nr:unnamed protein product [Penicillium salamii]CAG8102203.1 unnamed protein product [Penicillium salamii]CAG8376142.1 unnamed protein product [Penicillium salamii]CAG8377818.1 unnamed protein product [Penicillium salamii]CAG8379476.1 unnamed protein product [Penicillium salamii]